MRGSEAVYDKLRRDWAEKFLTVDNNKETDRALVVHSDEQSDKNEASGSCSDLLGCGFTHASKSSCAVYG